MKDLAQTPAAARLRAAAAQGRLAHALILSGGDARAARYAAAAMECTESAPPCLRCPACRKVIADIHPDVRFVRDPEHREIAVEIIREVRADAFIRPNEGARKVYIFEDCAVLNERGQNVLLKVVEEGPPYAAFLFCARNPAALLPTLRSRCVELPAAPEDGADETDANVREFCRLTAEGSPAERAAFAVGLEKRRREELGALFAGAREAAAAALFRHYGVGGGDEALARRLDRKRLMALAELLEACRRSCQYNVNVGLTLGGFTAEWEAICCQK